MIRVCVIGSGRAGMIHARNFAGSVPDAKLVAIVDPIEELAKKACKELEINNYYLNYQDALKLNNIDAVIVVTPTVYHNEIVVAAAKAGKHVLCEKPMAMTVKECNAMIKACKDSKVKLQIAFMRRFDESFLYAKKRVDSGEIGRVVLVKSLTHGPSTPKSWMYDIRKSNGPLAEVNSHDIDALHWYSGSYINEVYAIGGNFRSPKAKEAWPDFYDNVILTTRFSNGMQGFIEGAQGVQYGYDSRVEILGEKGIIFIGKINNYSVMSCNPNGMQTPFVRSWQNLYYDAYKKEDISFINCILDGSEPEVTGQDGMEAVKVVNAGNRSITEKKPIKLSR